MKKLLAMVLALVMTLSLAVSANAFKDDTKISDDYAEAVAVLNGMGVFKGYEDGEFKPANNITRAEVSAIVYRVYTQDVKDSKASLYATYNKFSDMTGAGWAAGYIGYCANAELVKGYPDGTFKPSGNVTGYEVLAMILRAVGYDKNGEFSGADWALNVAKTAQQAGILVNVKGVDLNAAASRELVAELLFRAIAKAPMVTYTPAFGYVTDKVLGNTATTLGSKNFNLKDADDADDWGRPAVTWTYNVGDKSTTYIEKPLATFTVATTECDIAAAAGLSKTLAYKDFTTYTNGAINKGVYRVEPKDTVQKLGDQGTLLEVYDDTIVMIDTFLAKVTDVKDATYDAAGHLRTEATIKLAVYNNSWNNTSATGAQTLTLTNGDENYGYAKGDYVLINAVMDNTAGIAKTDKNQYVEILNVAKSLEGAQTFLWYNSKQHTVEGTNYDDAKWFKLDEAGNSTAKYTWYFDNYGNLIGDTQIATAYTYGIIENIQWINPVTANGYAQATIRYMDGTSELKVVTSIDIVAAGDAKDLSYSNVGATNYRPVSLEDGYVSTTMQENDAQFAGTDLYRIATAADGTVSLKHVFTPAVTTPTTVAAYNNELTDATIKTNIAAISGTPSGAGASVIYVNSNTTFLVQTVKADGTRTYDVVKGYENIAKYSTAGHFAKVDYVYTDSDIYADYVYVTGSPDSAVSNSLFYLADNNVQAVLKTDGSNAVDYYVVKGYVDGVYKDDVKVAASAITTLVPSVGSSAVSNKNEMFAVTFTDDEIVSAVALESDALANTADLDAADSKLADVDAYANTKLAKADTTDVAPATFDGTVLAFANGLKFNTVYNGTNVAVLGGDMLTAGATLDNHEIYVLYNDDYTIGATNAFVAKAVYIIDKGTSGSDGEQTQNAVVNYQIKVIDIQDNVLKLLDAATYSSSSDIDTTMTYADLMSAMQTSPAPTGYVIADGALDYLTAQGLTTASANAQVVKVTTGNTITVIFTVAK